MKKYTLLENYFQSVETAEQAYILGFIQGDGCITRNTLAITVKDLDVLEFIKASLLYTGPIFPTTRGLHSLRVSNKKLCTDLRNLGIASRKAKNTGYIDLGTTELELNYVCGLFDSDGYIHIPKTDSKWKTSRKIGFSGTESVITGIKGFLEKEGFSKTQIKLEKCGTRTTHHVCKWVEQFYTLYKTSAYQLRRKLKLFKDNEIVYARLKSGI